MKHTKPGSSKHLMRALAWLTGTSLFALAPLLFLKLISILSEEDISYAEIRQLLEVGVILFAACAVTGSVVFDFITAANRIKGWVQFVAIYIFPFCIIGYLFLQYLKLYVQLNDQHDFGPGITAIWVTVVLSLIYSLFAKTFYYSRLEK